MSKPQTCYCHLPWPYFVTIFFTGFCLKCLVDVTFRTRNCRYIYMRSSRVRTKMQIHIVQSSMFQEDMDNQIATIGWILQENYTNVKRYIYHKKEKLLFN